jgi:hypothetical protein
MVCQKKKLMAPPLMQPEVCLYLVGANVGAGDCVGEAVLVGEFEGNCVGDDVAQSKQNGPSQTFPEAHTGLSVKGQPMLWKAA